MLNQFLKLIKVDKEKEESIALEYINKLNIKTPTIEQIVGNLSGGNQQKL